MLYDGECPLCMRETNMLRSRDAQHGNIDFVDVASPEYSPQRNAGLEYETAMGEIHALLPDATIVTKVPALPEAWAIVLSEPQPAACVVASVLHTATQCTACTHLTCTSMP